MSNVPSPVWAASGALPGAAMMTWGYVTGNPTLGVAGALVWMLGVWLYAQAVAQQRAADHELALKEAERQAAAEKVAGEIAKMEAEKGTNPTAKSADKLRPTSNVTTPAKSTPAAPSPGGATP